MKTRKNVIAAIGVVMVISAVALLGGCKKTEVHFNTATVEQSHVDKTVTATGFVQPVDKVDVGTQVSGVIVKLFVDFNSRVKKGDLLAELDKSTLSEKVTSAQADLTTAQSNLTFAQQTYDRTKQMYDQKAATQAAWDQAVNGLDQAKMSVTNAQANLYQAQVSLSYAEIYSPIDGVVLNRAVEQGQTVASSFNTPTLFTIARDLTKMQVEANVDEADIGQVRLGQKVVFTVDSYPDDNFEGTVTQIRLQPTVVSNVVTYTVIIEAPNPDEKLFPGMTASVVITTKTELGLTIPAEALTFQPDEKMLSGKQKEQAAPADSAGVKSKTVWIDTPDGPASRSITTGMNDGVNVIVKSGLNEGDKVILSVAVEVKAQAKATSIFPSPGSRPGSSSSSSYRRSSNHSPI